VDNIYTRITNNIRVSVDSIYLPEESSPDKEEYVWAYRVKIENLSDEAVTLRHRHWVITDNLGRTIEVHGQGVVGEEPTIEPGKSFEYTSGTPLPTASGIMVGQYEMEKTDGENFIVDIPAFSLDSPYEERVVN
jgi:ApaG protein